MSVYILFQNYENGFGLFRINIFDLLVEKYQIETEKQNGAFFVCNL